MQRLDDRLEIRLSSEEKRAIERAAERHRVSVSDYVRACVTQDQLADLDVDAVKRVARLVRAQVRTTLERLAME